LVAPRVCYRRKLGGHRDAWRFYVRFARQPLAKTPVMYLLVGHTPVTRQVSASLSQFRLNPLARESRQFFRDPEQVPPLQAGSSLRGPCALASDPMRTKSAERSAADGLIDLTPFSGETGIRTIAHLTSAHYCRAASDTPRSSLVSRRLDSRAGIVRLDANARYVFRNSCRRDPSGTGTRNYLDTQPTMLGSEAR